MTAYGPGHNITNAPSEDSDQPAQPYSVGREGSMNETVIGQSLSIECEGETLLS